MSKMYKHKFSYGLLGTILVTSMFNIQTANSAGFEVLRAHRAVYDVKLDEASSRSGISNMQGRIVYEMQGDACSGMTVSYRFVSDINANGEIIRTDQQSSSFESSDGKEYSFFVRSLVNDRLERELRGVATSQEEGIKVNLSSPNKREVSLANGTFLSAHLVNVLEAAKEGKTFFTEQVYDAADEADEVLKTTNIIGKKTVSNKILAGEKKEAVAVLENDKAWPVNIGYFGAATANSSEQVSNYEISFLLYDGGISRNLSMRYPDYSLTGSLVSLEMLDSPHDCAK